jgi:hypothetical protein
MGDDYKTPRETSRLLYQYAAGNGINRYIQDVNGLGFGLAGIVSRVHFPGIEDSGDGNRQKELERQPAEDPILAATPVKFGVIILVPCPFTPVLSTQRFTLRSGVRH